MQRYVPQAFLNFDVHKRAAYRKTCHSTRSTVRDNKILFFWVRTSGTLLEMFTPTRFVAGLDIYASLLRKNRATVYEVQWRGPLIGIQVSRHTFDVRKRKRRVLTKLCFPFVYVNASTAVVRDLFQTILRDVQVPVIGDYRITNLFSTDDVQYLWSVKNDCLYATTTACEYVTRLRRPGVHGAHVKITINYILWKSTLFANDAKIERNVRIHCFRIFTFPSLIWKFSSRYSYIWILCIYEFMNIWIFKYFIK